MNIKGLRKLFRFDGYCVVEAIFAEKGVEVKLVLDKRRTLCCPHCGRPGHKIEEEERSARDLPFGCARLVYVYYPAVRIRCKVCSKRSWLTPNEIDSQKGATKRLMRSVCLMCCHMPVSRVAELLNIYDTRLRRWDKAVLSELLGEVKLDNLRVLLVDEKAIGKNRQFVTVVLNGESGDLLHCHEGKKQESLDVFWDILTEEQKSSIEVVCIDRGGAYQASIEKNLQHADIAFDKFHLVQNLNKEVGDIRKDESKRLTKEGDEDGAAEIKGQRYNLIRRPENNSEKQEDRLGALLKRNETLNKSYMVLEDFRDALGQRYICHAETALESWIKMTVESGVEKLESFAKRISKVTDRIINAVRYQVSNGMIEGFNNLISRVIHRGCGYSDMDYLKLKLRQASMPECFKLLLSQT